MSYRIRSLSDLWSPLLEGTPRPRRRRWLVLLVVAGLAFLVGRATGSSGRGLRCSDHSDCASLLCSAGRCR